MWSRISVLPVSIALAALSLLGGSAFADFKNLVARVPAEANAIVLIDVGAVLCSPGGGCEGW